MIKVLTTYTPKYYWFKHYKCCTFMTSEDECEFITGQHNEQNIRIKCPVCGKQFLSDVYECNDQGVRLH